MNSEEDETTWKIISSYFEDNPQCLVRHHTESYNDFFKNGIFQIFKEKNPITINSKFDEIQKEFRHQCHLYLGGKNGDKIYFGKPVIYDSNDRQHYMFPNEARIRNMTYGMTIHYDIDVELIDLLEDGEIPTPPPAVTRGGYDPQTEGNYEEEHEEHENDIMKNFKEGGGDDDNAPAVKKPVRKRKAKSVEVEITPAVSNMIREQIAQSMIDKNTQKRTFTLEKIFLGKFPIMVQSEFCILNGLPREIRFNMGECRNDVGGYFIIDGKEKTIIPQEKFGDNMLYIRKSKDDAFLYSAEIRSVSENVSKPIRTLSVKMVAPTGKYTHQNIVVNIPNVRNPVPLFIVFRALGVISDKAIITTCVLDLEKYEEMVDLFTPCVYDAGCVMTQQTALQYIASLTKYGTISYALNILTDYFLPHVGETNFMTKAYHLGYIVFRMLCVYSGMENPTDRDHYKYKRVELVGSLLNDLFREYYTIHQKSIQLQFEKILYFNKSIYEDNLDDLVLQKYAEVFRERDVEIGFKKAFKGNWGSQEHTKRIGIVQDLNRLSFNSAISHLRKTNLPIDSSAKIVEPRSLHSSQWGFIDPVDTPDGANIGIHKTLAVATVISQKQSREPIINWLFENTDIKKIEEITPHELSKCTKVMVNGLWAGVLKNPIETVEKMKFYRRNAFIPIHTSVTFDIKTNNIYIYCDAGRVCRPIFYKDTETEKFSVENKQIQQLLKKREFTWFDLTTGFNKKAVADYDNNRLYKTTELYDGVAENPTTQEKFNAMKAVIDYIDPSESENSLILMNTAVNDGKKYTHLEIHESLIFGVMCNQITFPENNQFPRNAFSCGQSKQAVSLYHTNYQVRMDKTAVVLNNGQVPLVKTRYLEHINREENSYGENAIVAVMCYTGYNMEDSILINEGSIKRGLFNTTYFTVYETHEEQSTQNDNTKTEKIFTNFEQSNHSILGKKAGYDYSKLDKWGIIAENTPVDDKTVLIGVSTNNVINKETRLDASKTPKKGQIGVVDKSFITDGEEGQRIAKVRVCEIRIPNLGDKMASRNGQKGTVGLVIPECDMPFTKDGTRPDLIINPHALPSRMTIGQLVECITGKACAMFGGFGDCTAFNNHGSKIGVFGEQLTKTGFHSSGNEILYNGMTGEQIETEIFIGPTYYMRLKHMVKDKINFRARGPRTALTRQPVSGRANDGGLRIGEMERDVLISHGVNDFLRETMLDRGDKFYMAVCNQTGMLSIYNPTKNLFISPMADGPIQFTGTMDGKEFTVENVTKFGRSFSVICVPYCMKLLLQELQTINVQMRIITEDNIDQIENMTFSKNIERLMHVTGATTKDVIEHVRNALKNDDAKREVQRMERAERTVREQPPLQPVSPPYAPDDTSKQVNGAGKITKSFNVGDKVFYRGGKKSDTVWNVKHTGEGFYTIEKDGVNEDGENGEDEGDEEENRQVVTPNDIYDVNEVVYLEPTVGLDEQLLSMPLTPPPTPSLDELQEIQLDELTPTPQPKHNLQPEPHQPNIVFNPTIKIVNGHDNSIEPFSQIPAEEQFQTQTQPQPQPQPQNSWMQLPQEPPQFMLPPPQYQMMHSREEPQPQPQDVETSQNNEIDFNKSFVIKKI